MTEDDKFEDFLKAQNAIRDILFMYRECADYSCLYDDFGWEDGEFEPLDYIDCSADDIGMDGLDRQLLHEGSAIKLICHMMQCWGQGNYPQNVNSYTKQIKNAVRLGRLDHLPELKQALEDSFDNIKTIEKKCTALYQKYIVGYFNKLIAE